jgi:diguanylate cyclase (GGDEF)-like protein
VKDLAVMESTAESDRWRWITGDHGRGTVALHVVVAAVAIGVLSWSAVQISSATDGVALWWPAAGASVAAVITATRSMRVWIVVVVFAVSAAGNLAGGRPASVSLLFGVSNAAESAVASWWLLRGRRDRASLGSLPDLWRLVTAALMGAVTIAVGATLTVAVAESGTWSPTFLHVLVSHASAVLLIVPLVMRQPDAPTSAGRLEHAGQICATALVTLAVFGTSSRLALPFLTMVPLVWGALRLGLRVVTVEVVTVLVVALTLTAFGFGPFSGAVPATTPGEVTASGAEADFVATQLFVISTFVIVLAMTIVVTQRRALLARVSSSERVLRGGFDDALLGSAILRQRGGAIEVVEINPVAADLLGVGQDRSIDWTRVGGADAIGLASVVRDIAHGKRAGWRAEVELASMGGTQGWADVAVSAMTDEPGLVVLQVIDTTARKNAENELEMLAIQDTLTGLPNRTLLRDRLDRALASGTRTGEPVTVLILDLDDFKRINDTVGNQTGDDVLQEVAERLAAVVRHSDTVARAGGDEFVILLPGADAATVDATIIRISQVLDQPITLTSGAYRVTASIGVIASGAGSTVDQLLGDADTAMYVSKSQGRGLATWFVPSFRERAVRAASITSDFDGAVDRGEVDLFAQPIIDLDTGRIVAAEALVRWQHPQRGLLGPDRWLDIVNTGSAGQQLETWILTDACRQLALWHSMWGAHTPSLHVNVSTALLSRGDLAEQVEHALAQTGAPAQRLVIELTETDIESVRGTLLGELEQVRSRGVRVSVDDFGTGYSTLSRLAHLPLDELKIDQSFTAQMLTHERSSVIVNAIIGLAQALNLTIVAEGIETTAQRECLRDLGCQLGQGYLWSQPIPMDAMAQLIHHQHAGS